MKNHTLPLYRQLWFRIVAPVLLLFLFILVFTPRGISYGLREALLANGLDEVIIEDVDFNPFTGAVSIDTLQARKDGDVVLSLGGLHARVEWWPLKRQQLELAEVKIDELLLDMELKKEGGFVVAGIEIPAASTTDDDPRSVDDAGALWGVALHLLRIADSHLYITLPGQKYFLDLDRVRLEHLITWDPYGDTLLRLEGAVNQGSVHVDMQLQPFADDMRFGGTLALEQVELGDYAHFAADALQQLAGKLSLNNRFDIQMSAAEGLKLEQKGDLRVEGLQLQQQAISLRHKNLQWDGLLRLHHGLKAGLPEISMQGRLRHDGVSMELAQQALALRYGAFEWNGELGLAENLDESLKINGEIELQQLHVQQGAVDLVRLPKAHIRALASEGLKMIRADAVTLDGVEVLSLAGEGKEGVGSVFTANTLALENLQFTDMKNGSIAKIRMQDAQTSITRNEDGSIAVIALLTGASDQKPKDTEEIAQADAPLEEPQPPAIRIGEITMAGNSHVQFSDKAVQPAFNVVLNIDTFRLSELDSAKPENASPYHLAGKVGKYSTIDLQGDMQPFMTRPTINVRGDVKGVELPALSSYTARALGYDLSSGQLNADITLSILDGKIRAENTLALNNLNVKVSDPDKLKGLTTQLSMPLDVALSLLRDNDNNIHLKLPVGGDLQSPEFNLSDIINTALGKVMKKGAMTYLTQALQPYGALLTLAKMAGKAANAIALEPVLFEPVAVALPAKTPAYMEKVAGLMHERPGISIRLCGMATETDRAALIAIERQKQKQAAAKSKEEQARQPPAKPVEIVIPEESLLLLARKRAESLKDHLVNKLKVPAERLFICNPEVDSDKEGAPRVDLMI